MKEQLGKLIGELVKIIQAGTEHIPAMAKLLIEDYASYKITYGVIFVCLSFIIFIAAACSIWLLKKYCDHKDIFWTATVFILFLSLINYIILFVGINYIVTGLHPLGSLVNSAL